MPEVSEGLEAKTPLGSDLALGVGAISLDQVVSFTKYVKCVLPLDGFVFWVRADLVNLGAIPNAFAANAVRPGQTPRVVAEAANFEAKGSLHVTTDENQAEDATYATNRITFTSLGPINDLDDVGPNVMWIGEFEGLRFAFSSRRGFYRQAGLWHYSGNATYPIMESQLVDDVAAFSGKQLIVSNSLPLWLAMNYFQPAISSPEFFTCPATLYPSFLTEENADPPFGSVHVDPASMRALANAPSLGATLSHDQLASERVRVTLWGLDNLRALDFVDFVGQYTLATGAMGLMNSPIARDEKSTQVELGIIAQKKVVEFEVNYYQRAVRDVARQLIVRVVPSYVFS